MKVKLSEFPVQPQTMECCKECRGGKKDCIDNPMNCIDFYIANYEFIENIEAMTECRAALLDAFPDSIINERDEFIAHLRANEYFRLDDCKTPEDIECKVLEWLSRAACKTQPYSQEWRNKKFHEFMRNGINNFLDTRFSEEQMVVIYTHLGNAINHQKTLEFIKSNYDFNVLKPAQIQK